MTDPRPSNPACTMSLPSQFFLYISSRHSAADSFSGYILINAAQGADGVWQLAPAPADYSSLWTVNKTASMHIDTFYNCEATVAGPDGALLKKRFYNVRLMSVGAQLIVTSPGGPIPVLEMPKHTTVFGKQRLTRNVCLQWLQLQAPGSPLPIPAADATIQHVTEPKKKKVTPAAAIQTQPKSDLHLFVAKQLLEFAQSKHEMCPITAEEYITGQTAVMPCGHLFMRMAIEETFKKEPNKCPACRQTGRPTFI